MYTLLAFYYYQLGYPDYDFAYIFPSRLTCLIVEAQFPFSV